MDVGLVASFKIYFIKSTFAHRTHFAIAIGRSRGVLAALDAPIEHTPPPMLMMAVGLSAIETRCDLSPSFGGFASPDHHHIAIRVRFDSLAAHENVFLPNEFEIRTAPLHMRHVLRVTNARANDAFCDNTDRRSIVRHHAPYRSSSTWYGLYPYGIVIVPGTRDHINERHRRRASSNIISLCKQSLASSKCPSDLSWFGNCAFGFFSPFFCVPVSRGQRNELCSKDLGFV